MSAATVAVPTAWRSARLGRRAVAAVASLMLAGVVTVTAVSTALVPAGRDGFRARVYNGWYASAALVGLTLQGGQYQLDDARRLLELDPALDGYLGVRGAQFLVAHSPDAAERVVVAARLHGAGHDSDWPALARSALLDEGADAAAVLVALIEAAQALDPAVAEALAGALTAEAVVAAHGVAALEAALRVHLSPKTLTALAVATADPGKRRGLLEMAQSLVPGEAHSAGHLAVLDKAAAVAAGDRGAAVAADRDLEAAITALEGDAPAAWTEALLVTLPAVAQAPTITFAPGCCSCGSRG